MGNGVSLIFMLHVKQDWRIIRESY